MDSGPGDNEEMILGEIVPNDGVPVQWRPCFAHDRRPGVEATGGGAVCSCYRVVLERAA